jgi:hypothetical protein
MAKKSPKSEKEPRSEAELPEKEEKETEIVEEFPRIQRKNTTSNTRKNLATFLKANI